MISDFPSKITQKNGASYMDVPLGQNRRNQIESIEQITHTYKASSIALKTSVK